MKIPTDLDPNPPPLRRILAQNPPFKEFLDPPLGIGEGTICIVLGGGGVDGVCGGEDELTLSWEPRLVYVVYVGEKTNLL